MKLVLVHCEEKENRLAKGTELLFGECGMIPESMEITVEFHDRPEIRVDKKENHLHISCREEAHYYRALNRTLQHFEEESYGYQEEVFFERNGLMLDCSRNAVFTVEKIKGILQIMARLGMNVLMLYTEDTYEVEQEPYFGIYRGRYTRDELREIETYATVLGIELVPCIQTLAHLHNALKWPGMEEVRDSADILQVGKEETYQFITHLLSTVKDTFSTNRVHLGMDEAIMLGLGNYLKENGYKKSSLLVKEHCRRVMDICRKLGLEPMIWSDMYITSNTGGSYYQIPADADCGTWEKPDKDLGLVYWDYYHDDTETYEKMLDIHQQLSDKVVFAGGSWIWNGISPNYSKTFAASQAALQACKKYGIKEVLCTAWLDNGAETPVDALLPGLVLFAHLGFHREYQEDVFREEFQSCTGGEMGDFMALDDFDRLFLQGKENLEASNPSKYLLYQDPLIGLFDAHVKEADMDMGAYYRELQSRMEKCAAKEDTYAQLFSFYGKLAAVLVHKSDLGVRIKEAYDGKEKDVLKEIGSNEIPEIVRSLEEMKQLREELWMADAKPFGYELLDIRIGGVITRLKSAGRRIERYLAGDIMRLEELEETRLPYFAMGADRRENRWDRIVSGCDPIDTV